MSIDYGKYNVTCRFTSTAFLPVYKGSTLKGAVGIAFKRTVCALKRQKCADCMLKKSCLYFLIFKPDVSFKQSCDSEQGVAPHLIIIRPPMDYKQRYKKGSTLKFDIILLGKANQGIPLFIHAFDQMGRTGLGKRINGRRGTFELLAVHQNGKIIFDHEKKELNPLPPDKLCLNVITEDGDAITLRLKFNTPLKLETIGAKKNSLPFSLLAKELFKRTTTLFSIFGQDFQDMDFSRLFKIAEKVEIRTINCDEYEWTLYSKGKKAPMIMGGIVGTATYQGKLSEFIPFLEFCEQVNIGEYITFGHGNYKIEALDRTIRKPDIEAL